MEGWEAYNYGSEPVDPATADDSWAERELRKLASLADKRKRLEEHAKAEIARIQWWQADVLAPVERQRQQAEANLRVWMERQGTPTKKLIYGTIRKTAGRDKLVVEDEPKAIEWCRHNLPEALVQKTTISKEVLKAEIKSGATKGEIPPGTDLIRGEDSYTITTNDSSPLLDAVVESQQ